MGRELNAIGNEVQTGEANGYYLYDLFKFTGSGARSFVGTAQGYFSLDNGTTDLNDFNNDPDDDFGDWAESAGDDSFLAFSSTGVVNAVTATDLRVMDVLGWDLASVVVDVTGHGHGSGGGGSGRAGFADAPGPEGTTAHHGHAVTADGHAPHVAAVPVAPGAGPMIGTSLDAVCPRLMRLPARERTSLPGQSRPPFRVTTRRCVPPDL
jgi:hypothetical protein